VPCKGARQKKPFCNINARKLEGLTQCRGRKEAADNQERCSQINGLKVINSVRLSACKYPTRPAVC